MQYAPEVFFCSSCLPQVFAEHPEKVDVRQKHHLAAVAFLGGQFASVNAAAVAFGVRQQSLPICVNKLKKNKEERVVAAVPLTTLFPEPPIRSTRAVHDGTRLVALDIAVQRCIVERSKRKKTQERASNNARSQQRNETGWL